MNTRDIRWLQRFQNFSKALAKLAEVAEERDPETLSVLEKEGLIQRFEYTYELAWKTLQDLLKHKGYEELTGPDPVLEQAFNDGYIANAESWRNLKKSRELTSHTYDEATADTITEAIINEYIHLFHYLQQQLEKERTGHQGDLF